MAAENRRIRDFIRSIGGRITTRAQRDEYELLVADYFKALGARDEPAEPREEDGPDEPRDEDEDVPLAAAA